MRSELIVAVLIFSLIVPSAIPKAAYSGGAGGEPLMSDAAGWGIVGVLAVACIYLIYKTKTDTPADKDKFDEKTKGMDKAGNDVSSIVTPDGNLIIAKW